MHESDDGHTIAFGFTGVISDIATGLNNHWNRWYDAETGRWISEDPIGFGGGDANLNRYVGNAPTLYVDPSGLWEEPSGGIPGLEEVEKPWTTWGNWHPLATNFPFGQRTWLTNTISGLNSAHFRAVNLDNLIKARQRERAMLAGDIGGYTRNMRLSPAQRQFCQTGAETSINALASGGPLGMAGGVSDDLAQLAASRLEAAAASGASRRTFGSFDALKRALGPAGEGKVWHHIVEQRASNVTRFGAEAIHNTDNVISVSCEVNQKIANYYSSKRSSFTGDKTVRQWLDSMDFTVQEAFGLKILDRVLNGKPLP